jgi:hypothetical protein
MRIGSSGQNGELNVRLREQNIAEAKGKWLVFFSKSKPFIIKGLTIATCGGIKLAALVATKALKGVSKFWALLGYGAIYCLSSAEDSVPECIDHSVEKTSKIAGKSVGTCVRSYFSLIEMIKYPFVKLFGG